MDEEAYWVVDVVEASTSGEFIAGVDVLQSPHCEKHANGRAQCKEVLRLKVQPGVAHQHLWEELCYSHL